MKKSQGLIGMMLMASMFEGMGEINRNHATSDVTTEDLEERRKRLDRKAKANEARLKAEKGLKEYYPNIWASNQKNADRKARKQGLI